MALWPVRLGQHDALGTGVGGLLFGVCAIGERTVALRLESGSKIMLGKDR